MVKRFKPKLKRKRLGWRARKRINARRKNKSNYYFVRWASFTSVKSNALAAVAGAYTFQLSDLPDYTDFTALYDQYKISAVKLIYSPLNTAMITTTNGAAVTTTTPRFMSAIDYDDNTSPSSGDVLRQYQTFQTKIMTHQTSRYLKPRFATQLYRTSTTTGYQPKRGFVDCAQPDVPHYGLKWFVDATGIASIDGSFGYRVDVKYYLTFRNVR